MPCQRGGKYEEKRLILREIWAKKKKENKGKNKRRDF
jgi:hypothetical protein